MTYKVGTRVKLVRMRPVRPGSIPTGIDNTGLTGVVVPDSMGPGPRLPDTDIVVRADQSWRGASGKQYPAGQCAWTESKYWEPIIPEGAAEGSWDKCVWKPEKVQA